jgi:hypothetical protein
MLDAMGLPDAYGDTYTKDGDIFATSLRTGRDVDIGDDRSGKPTASYDDASVFGAYGYAESETGVRVRNEQGIFVDAVLEDGEYRPSNKEILEEPSVTERTEYDPFKISMSGTDNYGKAVTYPAWVLDEDIKTVVEPGNYNTEKSITEHGKSLDWLGGYDPKRGVFVIAVSGKYKAGTTGELHEVLGLSNQDFDWQFGQEYTIDQLAGRAISPVSKKTVVEVSNSKVVASYDIGNYSIDDFDINDFKNMKDTIKPKSKISTSTDMLVGGGSVDTGITTSEKKDGLGLKQSDIDNLFPSMKWGGQSVRVDAASKGAWDVADTINRGAERLSDMLPAGHVRNIGGGLFKTGVGIPSGRIMAGSAGVMFSEIAQQHPKAVLDVFKGTPGFMVEQKKQSYSTNAEEALTMDVANVALIGYGGFKMAGIKSISGKKATPTYNVKGSTMPDSKTGFVKPSEFSGGYKRVITLEDGTKSITSDVIIKEAPTKSESAELSGAMKTYESLKADVEYGSITRRLLIGLMRRRSFTANP